MAKGRKLSKAKQVQLAKARFDRAKVERQQQLTIGQRKSNAAERLMQNALAEIAATSGPKQTFAARAAALLARKIPGVSPKQFVEMRGKIAGGGHRGMALQNLDDPDVSSRNVARWRPLSKGQVEGFVFDGDVLYVHSSNVDSMQYLLGEKALIVSYKGGGSYHYGNVTINEALYFSKVGSKGGACWDILRIRGTIKGHRKPYFRIR